MVKSIANFFTVMLALSLSVQSASAGDAFTANGSIDIKIEAPLGGASLDFSGVVTGGVLSVPIGFVHSERNPEENTYDPITNEHNGFARAEYAMAKVEVVGQGDCISLDFSGATHNDSFMQTDFGEASAEHGLSFNMNGNTQEVDAKITVDGWTSVNRSLDGRYMGAETCSTGTQTGNLPANVDFSNHGTAHAESHDQSGDNYVNAEANAGYNVSSGTGYAKGEAFSQMTVTPSNIFVSAFARSTSSNQAPAPQAPSAPGGN